MTQHTAYNEVFWVAAVTSAPVIALATVVLFADTQKIFDLSDQDQKHISLKWYLITPIILIAANVFSQTTVMLFGLISLAKHKDFALIASVIVLEVVGMILVFSIAFINVLGHDAARKARSKASRTSIGSTGANDQDR